LFSVYALLRAVQPMTPSALSSVRLEEPIKEPIIGPV
jgi:hypothetical protein